MDENRDTRMDSHGLHLCVDQKQLEIILKLLRNHAKLKPAAKMFTASNDGSFLM